MAAQRIKYLDARPAQPSPGVPSAQPSPAQRSPGQLAPARARRSWSGPGRRSAYYVVRFLPLSPLEKNSWESFGRLEVWHRSPLVSLPLLAPLGLRKCILEQEMLKLACRLRPRWHSRGSWHGLRCGRRTPRKCSSWRSARLYMFQTSFSEISYKNL